MRAVFTTLMLLISCGIAQAACPANAVRASFSLWPENSLRKYQMVSGQHACGRVVKCRGGDQALGVPRSCRWA